MPLFRYKAYTPAGELLDGAMEASSADEVIAKIQDAGNLPVEAKLSSASAGGFGLFTKRAEFGADQVLQFTQQLATLLGAGQPLDRALQILLDLPESESARKMIERIRDAVRGGAPLSTGLEQQGTVFSRLYINMVRAGEAGGSLHDTLSRLADYLERSKALKENVINALIYPCILVVMVVGSLILLLGYVVPQFMPLFEDMGGDLPLITQIVLTAGDTLNQWWWVLVLALVLSVVAVQRQFSDPLKRARLDAWMLERKRLGDLLAKVETARLARTLGTLLHNGVPLLAGLSIARNVIGNRALVSAVEAAAEDVKTGGGLSVSLAKSKRFPRLALQMIQVGEESGELDGMLLKVADTFDVEVRNTLDRLLSALVPVLTIVMAGLIAMIVLAILLPILDLSSMVG
ncbi:type II secretion system inner membrane protein GspF [Pseudomarimonas arenosa]|uniref:Type II secretion system inner membrane protein GspF n=1 Tax=Pseudomarimonas arenosa TaxID=2774145 RepID=A0AAW3ZP87_9GAMM|nr:type II secretion system inner membrane protein GspF [Pseudomarimonas arenosa]MBD8526454.1 type II secretion system inner membrane protein GspF [Pseudomarimonas arenosa]